MTLTIRGRVGFTVAAFGAMAIAVVLALRMTLVVAATPPVLWTKEFVPVTTPVEGAPAVELSWLGDPVVVRNLLSECDAPADCLVAVDRGLAVMPASAALWYERSMILAESGVFDATMVDSLKRSYQLGPREGWVASERLPFALRMMPFLPPELLPDVGQDVRMIAADRSLAAPLIAAFIRDPFFRDSSWDVIGQFATLDEQERLIAWIRGEI